MNIAKAALDGRLAVDGGAAGQLIDAVDGAPGRLYRASGGETKVAAYSEDDRDSRPAES